MHFRIIPITQLSEKQTAELASLHQRVMHSLLSDLGLPVIERYYRLARKASTMIGFCALSEAGRLLGWVIGSSKPNQIHDRLREAFPGFIFQMIRVLVRRPRVIAQLFASLRTAAAPLPAGAIELTYLGVDALIRRQGIGREILGAFLQAARAAKYRYVVLSVEAENKDAIALYTRAGFRITQTFTEGNFHRHRMELTL